MPSASLIFTPCLQLAHTPRGIRPRIKVKQQRIKVHQWCCTGNKAHITSETQTNQNTGAPVYATKILRRYPIFRFFQRFVVFCSCKLVHSLHLLFCSRLGTMPRNHGLAGLALVLALDKGAEAFTVFPGSSGCNVVKTSRPRYIQLTADVHSNVVGRTVMLRYGRVCRFASFRVPTCCACFVPRLTKVMRRVYCCGSRQE